MSSFFCIFEKFFISWQKLSCFLWLLLPVWYMTIVPSLFCLARRGSRICFKPCPGNHCLQLAQERRNNASFTPIHRRWESYIFWRVNICSVLHVPYFCWIPVFVQLQTWKSAQLNPNVSYVVIHKDILLATAISVFVINNLLHVQMFVSFYSHLQLTVKFQNPLHFLHFLWRQTALLKFQLLR